MHVEIAIARGSISMAVPPWSEFIKKISDRQQHISPRKNTNQRVALPRGISSDTCVPTISIKQMSGSFTWHLSKFLLSAAPHSKNSARKYRPLFAAASIKCLQKSIQYVAASNTSESKVKIVTNIFGGIAKQCNRIKTWFD